MATIILLMFLLFNINTASRLERLSTAVFNLTKGGIERIFRPLTTLSRTEDTFRGSLRSSNGSNIAVNILGNTGGRLPYSVFGSAAEGGSLDFFGRIVSSIQPYLVPLRAVRTRKSGNSSALVWSTSEEHQKKR